MCGARSTTDSGAVELDGTVSGTKTTRRQGDHPATARRPEIATPSSQIGLGTPIARCSVNSFGAQTPSRHSRS
jgi:hypothetical protein